MKIKYLVTIIGMVAALVLSEAALAERYIVVNGSRLDLQQIIAL